MGSNRILGAKNTPPKTTKPDPHNIGVITIILDMLHSEEGCITESSYRGAINSPCEMLHAQVVAGRLTAPGSLDSLMVRMLAP